MRHAPNRYRKVKSKVKRCIQVQKKTAKTKRNMSHHNGSSHSPNPNTSYQMTGVNFDGSQLYNDSFISG
jgi:hypothetical protein